MGWCWTCLCEDVQWLRPGDVLLLVVASFGSSPPWESQGRTWGEETMLDAENEKQSSWVNFFWGKQKGSKSWLNVGMLLHLNTFCNYTVYKSARAELQTWFVMTETIKAEEKSVQCFQQNTLWCPRFTMFLRHHPYSGTRKSASNRKPLAQLNAVKHNMQNHEKHFTQLCSSISWRKSMTNWQTW